MKKIFLIIISLFLISSCWTSSEDIDKAKNDLLSGNTWVVLVDKISERNKENSSEIKEFSNDWISIKYLTEEKFLEIDNFSISDFSDLKQEVTWKTLEKVDKISVSFKNSEKNLSSDFNLSKFKSWDEKFMFRAFKEYNTLDYGENIYILTAYSWEKTSKLEYKIFLEKTEENNEETEEKEENKELEPLSSADISKMPVSATFWNPVEIWNGKVTYSDIKWLEIEQVWNISLENNDTSVTDFLKTKVKNIFYWNTKRSISWSEWLSFFVVRVDGNRYFYEKHYYTWKFYWVLPLETWDFEAEWTLEEKAKILSELNITLREKNTSFPTEKISNTLFQNLMK